VVDPGCFAVSGKYERPSFVYAGSMHKWQCFALTLEVYRLVKMRCPKANLTVLTAQQEEARRIIESAQVRDVSIDFVRLEQLQEYLKRFKYGFVLRERHVVNTVATPTKVSSYMAAGVIPVMTDAVADYVEALGTVRPMIISPHYDPEAVAEQILALERQAIDPDGVKASYVKAFADYFDHSRYGPELARFLQRTGLSAD
jgi:Glycosyl transferases group 1